MWNANRRNSGMTLLAMFWLAVVPVHAANYVVENLGINKPLTDVPGDPARAAAIMIDRNGGNCLSCHEIPLKAEFFGTTGPSLKGVGSRLSVAQLRLRLVDPKRINPMTMMPAYYKSEGFYRVLAKYKGKTILTAQQVEDIVAFLSTLKATR